MTASRSRERLVREDAETDVKRRAQEEGGGACLEEDARDDLKRRARRGRRDSSRKTSAISASSALKSFPASSAHSAPSRPAGVSGGGRRDNLKRRARRGRRECSRKTSAISARSALKPFAAPSAHSAPSPTAGVSGGGRRDDLKRRARRGRRECSRETLGDLRALGVEIVPGVLCSLRALPSRGRLERRTPRQSQTPSAPRTPRSFQENLGDLRELGVEIIPGVLCSLRALPSRGRVWRRTPRQSQTPRAPRTPRFFQEDLGDLRELRVEIVPGALCSLRALPSRGRVWRRTPRRSPTPSAPRTPRVFQGDSRRSP